MKSAKKLSKLWDQKIKKDVRTGRLEKFATECAKLDPKVEQALAEEGLWAREAASRYEQIASGKVKTKPAARVLREIRSKLK